MNSANKSLILTGLVVIVLLYTGYRVSYSWFGNPSTCLRCHEVEPYAVSWKKSPHSSVDCRSCHENRGIFRRLDFTIRGVRDIGIHFKGDYSFPMKAVVYESNCITCHLGDFKPELEAPPMPKGHAKHIKNGVGCNNCHRDTGHKNGLMVDESFK